MSYTPKWRIGLVLLFTLVLAGCIQSPISNGPGNNGGSSGPPVSKVLDSLMFQFELTDLEDVSKLKVEMQLHSDAPIATVPVRFTDLTIDHALGVATGKVHALVEGLWDVTVTAEIPSGPNRTGETQMIINSGEELVLQRKLAPDPDNAAKLLIH